ncbi:aldolase/citrate lyase family protein [Psychrobacillus sp. NPDC096426]|uniref:HpcH/HpaI aldolase/citrate lyase family protein n=1 Tax=Psychrobacillus sp. NPDC096426 TaxID=3364491 RepID=UPI0037F9073C
MFGLIVQKNLSAFCIDLKQEEGKEILDSLLSKADVFIQNLAPGAMDRLGFKSSDLLNKYPGLIICGISGYGSSGSYAHKKLGVHNAFNIASSSKRIRSLAFGSIDFTLDIKGELTTNGLELLFARSQLVIASRAARIESPIDTVFSDFKDTEGLTRETKLIKELGFQGKLVIHPSQISIVNDVFRPTQTEVEKAHQIVTAYETYKKVGKGVFEQDGKMVDLPVVEQAREVIDRSQY